MIIAPPTTAATPAKIALPVILGMPAVLELVPVAVAPVAAEPEPVLAAEPALPDADVCDALEPLPEPESFSRPAVMVTGTLRLDRSEMVSTPLVTMATAEPPVAVAEPVSSQVDVQTAVSDAILQERSAVLRET